MMKEIQVRRPKVAGVALALLGIGNHDADIGHGMGGFKCPASSKC